MKHSGVKRRRGNHGRIVAVLWRRSEYSLFSARELANAKSNNKHIQKISEEVLTEAKDEPVESLLLNQHQMNSINVSGSSLRFHEKKLTNYSFQNRNQEQSNHPTVSDIKDEFGDNDFIAEDGMQNVPGCSTVSSV